MRVVSLNIERSKHLDRVLPFLEKINPDVMCVQELLFRDISRFSKMIGGSHVWAPICLHRPDPPDTEPQVMGVGIFTKLRLRATEVRYYSGSHEKAVSPPAQEFAENHCLVGCDVESDGKAYRFENTHFTWSARGEASDLQRKNMRRLLEMLPEDCILAGDFNAPRGGEIFSQLSRRFKDNIPRHYETSIDVNLHRAGKHKACELSDKMVDGLFTTPRYVASNVELVFGVSDHAAIVADILKR